MSLYSLYTPLFLCSKPSYTHTYNSYLFIKSKPIYAPHFVVNQLKGYSSVKLRKEVAWFKSRLPTLWTRSYYIESVGHISEETIKRYIENQKKCVGVFIPYLKIGVFSLVS